jgi:glycosyltransferase involved in cell wall biosynthesis
MSKVIHPSSFILHPYLMILALDTNCILPGRVGGIESYVIDMIEALLGHAPWLTRLELLTRPENDGLFRPYASERCGVHLIQRPAYRGQPVTNWAALMQSDRAAGERLLTAFGQAKGDLLHRLKVDLVHFPGGTINPIDIDLPVALTIHDVQHRRFPDYFSKEQLRNREKWWPASADRAGAVIADSRFAAGEIREQFQVAESKLFVALPGVRESFLRCGRDICPAKASRRDACTTSAPYPFFLYPAANWPHKNHRRLLEAMAIARDLDAHLVLSGAGQDESELPGWFEELGLAGRVHLAGRVSEEELHALYQQAVAMIFPSQYEGFGLPLLEAMASGLPIAASNTASIPEVAGDAALLFDPLDPEAIAEAMLRLDGEEALRERLRRAGRERVALFTPERFAGELHLAYLHAAG